MRLGLNQLASRSIHGPSTTKYTSINPRGNYIEFRSPGGDWLAEDISTLVSTMMRFVVALDAAVEPSKYRKEYLSKLQKLLAPKSDDDPIEYFVKYSSGQLPKQALKSFIRQAQLQRKIKKEQPAGAPYGPIKYEIYDLHTGRVVQQINANNDDEAIDYFYRITPDEDRQHVEVRRARDQSQPETPTLTAPETQPDANFAFVDRINNQVVHWLTRNTRWQAERVLQGTGLGHLYSVVEVVPRTSSTAIPGSTLGLQRQQSAAASVQGEFTGQWRILIDGEEVHRFGGVGNVQADANRFATRWLLAQQRAGSLTISDSAEIELLPVMGEQRPN
jgi:hypothetical protein